MWKILITSFGVIFLAEIGDKTQLSAIALASRYRSPWVVFAGAAVAMIAATAVGISLGTLITSVLGERAVRAVSGGLFILFGLLILMGK